MTADGVFSPAVLIKGKMLIHIDWAEYTSPASISAHLGSVLQALSHMETINR